MNQIQKKDFTFFFENEREFRHLYKEIFEEHVYYAELEEKRPMIVDIGAHLGISTLYFKKLFPEATVLAFEPNPYVFDLLKKNIEVNHLEQVFMLNSGVSLDSNQEAEFYIDKADTRWYTNGSLREKGWDGKQKNKSITVSLESFDDVIPESGVDLVKMDIEGHEHELFGVDQPALERIQNLMVEFHPRPGYTVARMVEYFSERGFDTKALKHGSEIDPETARGLVIIQGSR